MKLLAIAQLLQCLLGHRERKHLLLGPVALALDEQHRAIRIGEVPHHLDPVGERMVAEGQPAMLVGAAVLLLFRPDHHQHRGAA